MVGVNPFTQRFGTVAIFATLFAAIQVNCEKGCVFDFEQVSDFDFECNNLKRSWVVNYDAKESPERKVLTLAPENSGCLKTKHPIILNATSPITVKAYREGTKDENEKITLRVIPKDGSCSDEDCVWDLTSDAQYKPGEWVTAKHQFPLKSVKEYYVQLQVEKSKGKLLVDSISLPTAFGDSNRCQMPGDEAGRIKLIEAEQLVAVSDTTTPGSNTTSFSPGFAEISKNLMLTSASVLTLNNLLN